MNRPDLAVVLICGLIYAGYVDYTDPERVAERQARQYAWNYPCINGVRYIRSSGRSESLTPMIDPSTMHPERAQ